MNEWQETQEEVLTGLEDYKIIMRAITEAGEALINSKDLILPDNFRDRLYGVFPDALASAEKNFLSAQRRSGKDWTSIAAFIEEPVLEAQRTMRRNYLKLLAWRDIKGRLVEILCLLSTLLKAEEVKPGERIDPIKKISSIQMIENGKKQYLWTRPLIS